MTMGSKDNIASHDSTQKESEEHGATDEVLEDWEAALENSEDESSHSDVEGQKEGTKRPEVVSEKPEVEAQKLEEKMSETKLQKHKELRSPIICILGHVDTGKTKLLDKIRQTNVQEGEAGGITQQIGATYFPLTAIQEKTAHIPTTDNFEFRVPGLLIIDTPGHESFTNLRTRGSSLCNIAILVVDLMHGLEPQTIESIGLLRQRKTPFLVALNKIDRLYGWKAMPNVPVEEAIKLQNKSVQSEFQERLSKTQLAFSEQGLNAELFYQNTDVRKCVSLVPTSAITGDGIGDMIMLTVRLTQTMMTGALAYLSALHCTVLEVKVIEGLGTTIDVILSNGILREGDRIAVCGLNGPIVTSIRSLLTPQPLRELRIKSQYIHNKQVKAALGVKICAPDLEKAVAGSQLLLIDPKHGLSEEEAKKQVMQDLTEMLESVDKSGKGVCVQASTLGSLEALLSFLHSSKIPVSGVSIGPVHKKDIIRASVMLEQDAKEYAVLLAFDVKIDKDVQDLADELDVKIFSADIIYHLFDQFTAYMQAIEEQKRKDAAPSAVFPCILKIVPGCVFNKRSPLVLGVDVVDGILRVGTPICVMKEGQSVSLGRVSSIELNHKPVEQVRRGGPSVAVKLEQPSYEPIRQYGRHFTEQDDLLSRISRQSIDILKEAFRQDMDKEDWALIIKLKRIFNIQ